MCVRAHSNGAERQIRLHSTKKFIWVIIAVICWLSKKPKKKRSETSPGRSKSRYIERRKNYKDNMRLTAVLPHVHATKWRNCFSYFPLKLKLTACIGKHRKSLSFRSGGRPIPQIYPCCGSKKMSRRRRRGRRRDRRPIHFSGRGRALTSNEKFSGSPRVVCLRFSF